MLAIPVPTASRLVKALREEGFLAQDPKTRLYSLGFKSYIVGAVARMSGVLRSIALPYMNRLRDKYNETVNLYIREGDFRVCYEQLESTQYLKRSASLGVRLPIGAGASGRCFLAFLPEEYARKVLGKITALTENTIVDVDIALGKIQEVRERGYSISAAERENGVSSVASPILDVASEAIGSIAVSGPSLRFTGEMIEALIPDIKTCCREISTQMGAREEDIPFLS